MIPFYWFQTCLGGVTKRVMLEGSTRSCSVIKNQNKTIKTETALIKIEFIHFTVYMYLIYLPGS